MRNELEVVNIRLVKEPSLYSEKEVRNPGAVVELMGKEMAQYDREVVCVLNMKTNSQVINMNIVSMGTINTALVSPREVFKSSILSNAATIILLHNHPSGNTEPSREDRLMTKRLYHAGQIMDIELLDHIIVGGGSGAFFSFRENRVFEELTMGTEDRDFGQER